MWFSLRGGIKRQLIGLSFPDSLNGAESHKHKWKKVFLVFIQLFSFFQNPFLQPLMLILHLLGVVKGIPLSKIIDKTFFSIELCGIACSANEKACNILFFNSMNNYCYLGKVLQLPNPNEEEDVVSTDRLKIRLRLSSQKQQIEVVKVKTTLQCPKRSKICFIDKLMISQLITKFWFHWTL